MGPCRLQNTVGMDMMSEVTNSQRVSERPGRTEQARGARELTAPISKVGDPSESAGNPATIVTLQPEAKRFAVERRCTGQFAKHAGRGRCGAERLRDAPEITGLSPTAHSLLRQVGGLSRLAPQERH